MQQIPQEDPTGMLSIPPTNALCTVGTEPRYLLFYGDELGQFDPDTLGWDSFRGAFDSPAECHLELLFAAWEWWQIVDKAELRIMERF